MWQGWNFPGDPVVKNLPSNAEGVGSIPGREIKISHASWQLSLCAATTEPMHSGAHKLQLEKWSAATKTRCSQINKLKKKKDLAGLISGEDSLSGLYIDGHLLIVLIWQKEQISSGTSSYKVTNPIFSGPHPYDLI